MWEAQYMCHVPEWVYVAVIIVLSCLYADSLDVEDACPHKYSYVKSYFNKVRGWFEDGGVLKECRLYECSICKNRRADGDYYAMSSNQKAEIDMWLEGQFEIK